MTYFNNTKTTYPATSADVYAEVHSACSKKGNLALLMGAAFAASIFSIILFIHAIGIIVSIIVSIALSIIIISLVSIIIISITSLQPFRFKELMPA